MKVLLINPPLSRVTARRLGPVAENLFYNSVPLGLCYLAAVLEKENHTVKIMDAAAESLRTEKIIKKIKSYRPDVIGITTFTVSIWSCYELARSIKKNFPDARIVTGGPHVSSNAEDLLAHPEFDIAVIGEGEITFKELIEAIEKGNDIRNINGIAYRIKDGIFFTSPRAYIPSLDTLPFPARHLVPVKHYRPQPNDQKGLPKLSIISSRGCLYQCIFCDKNVFTNIYRTFSPGYIVSEMQHLVKEYKAKDIAFVDSTFTPNRERVRGIINEIRRSNVDVSWTCSVRADVLDRELLKDMKNAGCWRVRIGIESGNNEVLKFIKKGITKDQVRKVAAWSYELDLQPKGFFMIGHLTDTKDTIEETIDFACELPLKDITVQINTPLKNTPQYNMMKEYGNVVTRDFSNYSFWQLVFLPRGLKGRDILDYYRKFYLRFYLRPILWYRHIVQLRSFYDIIRYIRGIKIIAFFLISRPKRNRSDAGESS